MGRERQVERPARSAWSSRSGWGTAGVYRQRLEREKRRGIVEQVDEHHYRFTAEVFDTVEMLPWIRTFICRITKMNFSNRTAENPVQGGHSGDVPDVRHRRRREHDIQ